MSRFRVKEAVHVETHHETHGHVEASFDIGDTVPRSEQEEVALLHLTYLGLAEQVREGKVAAETGQPATEEEVTDAPQ